MLKFSGQHSSPRSRVFLLVAAGKKGFATLAQPNGSIGWPNLTDGQRAIIPQCHLLSMIRHSPNDEFRESDPRDSDSDSESLSDVTPVTTNVSN